MIKMLLCLIFSCTVNPVVIPSPPPTGILEIISYTATPSPITEFPVFPTFDYGEYNITPPIPITYPAPISYLYPTDLDAIWDNIEMSGISDAWQLCTNITLYFPIVTWEMATWASNLQTDRHSYDEISILSSDVNMVMMGGGGTFPTDGNIRMLENEVAPILYPYYQSGEIKVCRDINNKPTLYGDGINLFLMDIYTRYRE